MDVQHLVQQSQSAPSAQPSDLAATFLQLPSGASPSTATLTRPHAEDCPLTEAQRSPSSAQPSQADQERRSSESAAFIFGDSAASLPVLPPQKPIPLAVSISRYETQGLLSSRI
eukprot:4612838-Amphidinium_carterae.1